MLKESQRLDSQIEAIDKQIPKLPKGNIYCLHNGKFFKWYKRDGKKLTYIPKKNRQLAERLATKKYLSLLREDLIQEKEAVKAYLKIHNSKTFKSQKLLEDNSEYRDLISSNFIPTSKELQEWMDSPYQTNLKNPEQLIFKTNSGHVVRSKSEVFIDMALSEKKIPFRYECILELNHHTYFPDFTIKHPKTGEIYYWEHFGLMDNPEYCASASSKIYNYAINGIIPSVNLITTYETKEHPLNPELVNRIIEQYFS